MSDENIIDVDQNETDTCEEITDTDTISGEDKSENISTNEAAGTTEDIDVDYSIDEEPGESSEDTSCSEANDATTVSGATASQVAETGGSKRWNEYTSSTDLDDTDELMILDTSAKANKRTLLSKLSDYVLAKLADKVFAKLETKNQTVIGALNELNSKAPRGIITGTTTLEEYCSKNKKLPGEYRINGAIISGISSTEKFWGVLILSAVYDTQIVIVGGGNMYIRDYTGNPNTWSKWAKYTNTKLS